jgi:uncharacterized protein (TIGR02646 family)
MMVTIKRSGPPRILLDKGTEWRDNYLQSLHNSANRRPRSDRYGHSEVREELRRMGHGKCFYCEQEVSEETEEIDHHIEVREKPDLSFDWRNLYLACNGCNKKKFPNHRIPVTDCVDPCGTNHNPAEHLYFNKEKIKSHSDRGKETIRKYRLDRTVLSLQRSNFLNQFADALEKIHEMMIAEGRKTMNAKEQAFIQQYRETSQPFSLMMSARITGKILYICHTAHHNQHSARQYQVTCNPVPVPSRSEQVLECALLLKPEP